MIPKVHKRGVDLHRLLNYLFHPRQGQHRNPRIIAAWAYATMGDLAELQPPTDVAGRRRLAQLTNLLKQPVHAGRNPPPKYTWHCSVHNHPNDPPLTDQQWAHIATEIVAATGLAPHGDLQAVRWIAIRHATSHAHIVATLVRQDRRTAWIWNDYRTTHTACRQLEQHLTLHQVATQPPTNRPPKPAELNKATRQNRNHVPREHLRQQVRATAAATTTEAEFFNQLRTTGLLLRLRTTATNTITGYTVALPDHHNAAGNAIWYSGAKLAQDLTLGQLRTRWTANSQATDHIQ